MKLKPGTKKEYIRRYNAIWPELRQVLSDSGVRDYSTFLDERTNTLFGVQKITGQSGSQDLGNKKIVQKWWDYVADIMETNPDHLPVSVPLEEVFYKE